MNLTKAESVDVYLSEAARKALASLINSLQVSEILKKESLEKDDFKEFKTWRDSEYRATVELFEVFGIELPCLEDAQYRLNENDPHLRSRRRVGAHADLCLRPALRHLRGRGL